MSAARQVAALVWKDLLLEWRTKELFLAMALFALVMLVIFNFAFEFRPQTARALGPGVLWSAILFAGILGMGRSFTAERDQGTLQGLLLGPMDRALLYLGKLTSNFLFMLVLQVLIIPLFIVLFNLSFPLAPLVLLLLLATLGFSVLATLFAAMAAHTRAQEVLLPLLLLPLLVPVIIAAVRGTAIILQGPSEGLWPFLNLLTAFDALFLGLAYLLFNFVVED